MANPTNEQIIAAIATSVAALYKPAEDAGPPPGHDGPIPLLIPPLAGCTKHPQAFSGWLLNAARSVPGAIVTDESQATLTRVGSHLREPKELIELSRRVLNLELLYYPRLEIAGLDLAAKGVRKKLEGMIVKAVSSWLGEWLEDAEIARVFADRTFQRIGADLCRMEADGEVPKSSVWEVFAHWDLVPTVTLGDFIRTYFIVDTVEAEWQERYEAAMRKQGEGHGTPGPASNVSPATAQAVAP